MKRLVLIDAHAVIHRAWHALPPLTGPDGQPVSAVYGFVSILLKMLKDLKPDYVAAAFDHEGPTFRHLAYERYKAERVKAPPALYQQIPMVKDLVKTFGIPITEKRGYEADDIIGTIAGLVRRQHPDTEIIIVTGDLDTLQLVDRRTRVFTMRRGVTDTVLYDEAAVRERYGLSPAQLIDFKGLAGDPSDNIPGVKGVGAKTASALLKRYGSIEKIYQALKKSKLTAKPSAIEALRRHEADALFSKTLVTIDRNVPIKFVLASARLRKSAFEKVRPALEKLGFSSLIRRLGGQEADATSIPSSSPELKLPSPRVIAAKTFDAVPRRAEAAMLKDPGRALILVAVDSSHVYEVPVAALAGSQARSWFASRPPSYVFGLKSFLYMGLAFELANRVRDLAVIWWLLEPGRRSYEPEVLIRRELRGVIAHTPLETAALLQRLIPILEKRLHDEDLLKVYEELESPLTPLLYQMEKRGIGFRAAHLKKLSARMKRELQGLEKKIHRAAGGPFNINSPRQLSSVLFERLNLAPKGIRKTEKLGVISTRESELTRLRHLHPIIGDILRYREITKLKSNYVDALPKLVGSDGRIHTTWNQTGTVTGRLSSQNPNLQNIPIRSEYGREIRNALVAEKGLSLVACDYSQLELR
ncbi:MAG: DNA polymerase, partial [Patescibacteria group bacterium]